MNFPQKTDARVRASEWRIFIACARYMWRGLAEISDSPPGWRGLSLRRPSIDRLSIFCCKVNQNSSIELCYERLSSPDQNEEEGAHTRAAGPFCARAWKTLFRTERAIKHKPKGVIISHLNFLLFPAMRVAFHCHRTSLHFSPYNNVIMNLIFCSESQQLLFSVVSCFLARDSARSR